MTMRDLLLQPTDDSLGAKLFLSFEHPWALDTQCALTTGEAEERLAEVQGMEYVMFMDAVHDVVANARRQRPDAPVEALLEALLFYYDNDAFIVF